MSDCPRQKECDLIRAAINESGDCLPSCDSYGHDENCPNVNMLVVLRDQQAEIERLRRIARGNGHQEFCRLGETGACTCILGAVAADKGNAP